MSLTSSNIKTIIIVSHITGFLSCVGSSCILFDLIKRRRNNEEKELPIRLRLVAGMSTFDLASSVAYALASWPVPSSYPFSFWNYGNQQTCNAQAFFIQWSVGAICYNTCIAIYYFLLIHQNINKLILKSRVEPLMHTVSISFTLATAIAGIPLTIYNPIPWFCWIYSSPIRCYQNDAVDCIRGETAGIFHYVFLFGPLWFAMILILVLMVLIYCKIKRLETNVSARYSYTTAERKRHSQLFKHQAVLYVGIFYITWLFRSLQKIMSDGGAEIPFWVFFLSVLFAPLQGFGNAIVYFYPRFMAKRRRRSTTNSSSNASSFGTRRRLTNGSSNNNVVENTAPRDEQAKTDISRDDKEEEEEDSSGGAKQLNETYSGSGPEEG